MIADARLRKREMARCCIRHDGIPKRAWPTRRMAHRYGHQVWGTAYRTYECPECGHWHNATKEDE